VEPKYCREAAKATKLSAYEAEQIKHLQAIKTTKNPTCFEAVSGSCSGGRCRVRTCDPCRVKAVLYH
jgi:hypothetical protein